VTRDQAPLVTIGLPVYNGAALLPQALDALLAQEWPNLQLLVADNASTDASAAIAESYAARDPRVRLLRSPVNAGIEANFSRVLAAADGQYFMWAACDDWWDPRFVSCMVAALEVSPSAVVAMSAVERVDETGAVRAIVRHSGSADPSRMSPWQLTIALAGGKPYHLYIYGLFRSGFLRRAFTGFPAVIAADRLLMCRVAMAGGFAYVDEVLHRRLVRQTTIAERYASEPLGVRWRGSSARWRLALAAGPYLWRSPVLPPARRWWVPAVVLRFLKATVGHSLAQSGLPVSFVKIADSTKGARND
jgi:glycosyltransferase involved in cell wall biosynthesis